MLLPYGKNKMVRALGQISITSWQLNIASKLCLLRNKLAKITSPTQDVYILAGEPVYAKRFCQAILPSKYCQVNEVHVRTKQTFCCWSERVAFSLEGMLLAIVIFNRC